MVGDSVVFESTFKLDQRQVGTALAASQLNCWVGNVSAGSWGPANQVAFFERFGWFDADVAILVMSTHDLVDLPLGIVQHGVTEPPLSMLAYFFDYTAKRLSVRIWPRPKKPAPTQSDRANGIKAVQQLLQSASNQVPAVVVVVHPELNEQETANGILLRETIEASGLPVVYPKLTAEHYVDWIHLSAKGQEYYGKLFADISRKVPD